jgi:hypothetical protein
LGRSLAQIVAQTFEEQKLGFARNLRNGSSQFLRRSEGIGRALDKEAWRLKILEMSSA